MFGVRDEHHRTIFGVNRPVRSVTASLPNPPRDMDMGVRGSPISCESRHAPEKLASVESELRVREDRHGEVGQYDVPSHFLADLVF